MGDVIPAVVGTDEEDQITSFQRVTVGNDLPIPGLFLGTAREFDPVGGKRGISQSGTVHAAGADPAHAMGCAHVFFGCADHLIRLNPMGS